MGLESVTSDDKTAYMYVFQKENKKRKTKEKHVNIQCYQIRENEAGVLLGITSNDIAIYQSASQEDRKNKQYLEYKMRSA